MNILAKKSKAKGSTLLKSFKGLSVNPGADGDERWWHWRYCNSSGLKCMSFKQRLSTCEITSRSWNLQIPYTPNISFEANMISNKPRQSWWDNANLSIYNTSFSFKNISLSRRNGKISRSLDAEVSQGTLWDTSLTWSQPKTKENQVVS